jgi:phage tail sheath protein FI
MNASLNAPGVYIQEEPSGSRSITGVSTSITAFIGRARRGTPDAAVRIDSFGDYERRFGGLWTGSDLGHMVRQFYQNGGRAAYVVRVENGAVAAEGRFSQGMTLVPSPQAAALPGFDHLRVEVTHGGASDDFTLTITAETAGDTPLQDASGPPGAPFTRTVTLRVGDDIAADLAAATTATTPAIPLALLSGPAPDQRPRETTAPHLEGEPVSLPSVSGMTLVPTVEAALLPGFDHLRAEVAHGAAADAFTLTITAVDSGDLTLTDGSGPPGAPYTLSVDLTLGGDPVADIAAATTATSPPIPLAVLTSGAPASRPAATVPPHVSVAASGGAAVAATAGFLFRAADPGSWGDGVEVTVTPDPGGQTFGLTARLVDTGGREADRETYNNLVLAGGTPTSVAEVLAARSSLIRSVELPDVLPSDALTVSLAGGEDGTEPDVAAYTGSPATRSGLYALDSEDVVNLLCVAFPRGTDVVDVADRLSFWTGDVLGWCRTRGAMAIIDPPPSWTGFDQVDADLSSPSGWSAGVRSPHAAQYFPEIVAADPLQQNRLRAFAPSGAVAGVIARTDAARGVWKAPAGTDAILAGTLDLSVLLTDGEQGVLNRAGINCARAWPGTGRVLWGARTLYGDDRRASEWKYLPVRRLASFLQQSLLRGTRWAVFEPNDQALWAQLRLSIEGFMHQLFRQGAFAGSSPQEAYFVKCDADTTTQADIDAGIVTVRIGFAPVKPVEFVVLTIRQIAGQ